MRCRQELTGRDIPNTQGIQDRERAATYDAGLTGMFLRNQGTTRLADSICWREMSWMRACVVTFCRLVCSVGTQLLGLPVAASVPKLRPEKAPRGAAVLALASC